MFPREWPAFFIAKPARPQAPPTTSPHVDRVKTETSAWTSWDPVVPMPPSRMMNFVIRNATTALRCLLLPWPDSERSSSALRNRVGLNILPPEFVPRS